MPMNSRVLTKTKVKQPLNYSLDIPESDVSTGGVSDICLTQSAENVERFPIERIPYSDYLPMSLVNEGYIADDPAVTLRQSLSSKWVLPNSPGQSESGFSKANSPKGRFNPIKKVFDPIIKSKSQRSLAITTETSKLTTAELFGLSWNNIFRKSSLQIFSNRGLNNESRSPSIRKEHQNSIPIPPCSPAHLRGFLKLQNNFGVPFFEFLVKFSEDVFVAKTWKMDGALSWLYTFHSTKNKSKSSAVGWGPKESSKLSSMVGQMQVSCYSCAELNDTGAYDKYMITEFVLFDIAHARKNVASADNFKYSPSNQTLSESEVTCEVDDVSDEVMLNNEPKHASKRDCRDLPTCHPFAAAELQPNSEIAAILIQVPFGRKDGLTCNSLGGKTDMSLSNLLDLSEDKLTKKGICDSPGMVEVKVVTQCGNHSLPSNESRGPSPLLDRWRMGGGCDCGGWDMACPLTVLGNSSISSLEEPYLETQRPLELFIQGKKEKTPALILTAIGEGHYAVDFHGQLSKLQAFSICVAFLHATKASISSTSQEKGEKLLHCNSLRLYVNQEFRERKERAVGSEIEDIVPSFVTNPPFSPIARV